MDISKKIRKSLYQLYLKFNYRLKYFESFQVQDPLAKLPQRPIFILGAPRSGSTLTYQVLCTTLDVSYFSNTHCFWFGAPWLVERITDTQNKFRSAPTYKSKHGHTKGWAAPSECAEYWYRFFRRNPPYLTQDDVSKDSMRSFRASLHAYMKAANKPLLVKNLYSVLRLEPLIKALPEAIFLVIHRDLKDTAHSILEARKRKFGNYNDWFSLEVPTYKSMTSKPPEEQVVKQIQKTYELIANAEQKFPNSSFFHFNYEEFCKEPNKIINTICLFLRENDIAVEKITSAPNSFEIRDEIRISDTLYKKLNNYIKNIHT